jgi:2-polyprenyl-3-methyl-5-hydroxy-6-metoxy-1,4-benzoquinol methylase
MWQMLGAATVEELQGCTIDEVRDSWARVAQCWCSFVRGHHDVHRERLHGPALLQACGDAHGRRVLDLGCGEGWCSRELARRGASVAGVDVCDAMIAEAQAHPLQACQRIEYHVMDAVDVHHHRWPRPFDLVTACMSLHNMPDPAGVLRAARGVLAADGRLVCSIPHPLTHMVGGRQSVRHQDDALYLRAEDYFRSAPYRVGWHVPRAGEPWSTIRWSRTLSEYTRMLKNADFVIHDQLEPRATCDEIEEHERLRSAEQLPYYLILVAGLRTGPSSTDAASRAPG